MIKIAISGKARSGKNTLSKLLIKEFGFNRKEVKQLAFADPIKKICKIMFPSIPNSHLFGPSELRSSLIESSESLTVRNLLLEIGTYPRKYNENTWINNFNLNFIKNKHKKMFIVPDLRFKNELDYLKSNNFFLIRIKRNETQLINHISETGQDQISDEYFDAIVDNNKPFNELKQSVKCLIPQIINKFELI